MIVAFVGLGLVHRPAGWPGSKTLGDEWTALGTLYSFGGFLLAAFAALLATIAYINSTEKPRLFLHSSYALHFQDWSFALRLENRGPVAARFVAVRLRFSDATISLPYDDFPMGPWKTGPAGWEGDDRGRARSRLSASPKRLVHRSRATARLRVGRVPTVGVLSSKRRLVAGQVTDSGS